MEKIKIEPGTVQETLLIPLYGRKQAMDRYPDIFMDHDCQEIFSHVDFQVSEQMRGKIGKIGSIMGATRQFDMASVCRTYLKDHPKACVVNLGCGLDTTFRQVDNGHARAYNLDFPDAIADYKTNPQAYVIREGIVSARRMALYFLHPVYFIISRLKM